MIVIMIAVICKNKMSAPAVVVPIWYLMEEMKLIVDALNLHTYNSSGAGTMHLPVAFLVGVLALKTIVIDAMHLGTSRIARLPNVETRNTAARSPHRYARVLHRKDMRLVVTEKIQSVISIPLK